MQPSQSMPPRGSYPPRPIERPPRQIPVGATNVPPKPKRRGRRIVILLVCLIIALTAVGMVLEGIFITTGKHFFF